MAVHDFDSPFAIIVSTNDYTGNFEREFCAYVTGAYGECGVGDELAKVFHEEEGEENYLSDITDQVMDDRGCSRPVSIFDDGDHYNSLIIFLNGEPDPEEWDLIVRRAKQFCEKRPDWRSYNGSAIVPIQLKGIRLIKNEVVRSQTVVKQEQL